MKCAPSFCLSLGAAINFMGLRFYSQPSIGAAPMAAIGEAFNLLRPLKNRSASLLHFGSLPETPKVMERTCRSAG
ncbi:hypothetical protein E2C01_044269 [Portunus trituberculatus]|uniref:Uncharacterized protein n=1 Tax=Portunus trituberculatus TaxID=210409 RepID=A0A5B7FSP0_PORTR|nr:hypothetical protein [Portunus trituberculatus]